MCWPRRCCSRPAAGKPVAGGRGQGAFWASGPARTWAAEVCPPSSGMQDSGLAGLWPFSAARTWPLRAREPPVPQSRLCSHAFLSCVSGSSLPYRHRFVASACSQSGRAIGCLSPPHVFSFPFRDEPPSFPRAPTGPCAVHGAEGAGAGGPTSSCVCPGVLPPHPQELSGQWRPSLPGPQEP